MESEINKISKEFLAIKAEVAHSYWRIENGLDTSISFEEFEKEIDERLAELERKHKPN